MKRNFSEQRPNQSSEREFKCCNECRFYKCELVNEYVKFKENNQNSSFLSYNQESNCVLDSGWEQEPRWLMPTIEYHQKREYNWKYVPVEIPPAKYVAHGIGEQHKINIIPTDTAFEGYTGYRIEERADREKENKPINKWEPSKPVFISAQTGRGKNTFVEKNLLSHVSEINLKNRTKYKILILSNRLALTAQMKRRLNQGLDYQEESDDDKPYSYAEINPNAVGGRFADIMSYQSFLNKRKHLEKEQGWKDGKTKQKNEQTYLFVILDEAHFFTSDSMFNPYTAEILKHLVRIFRNAVRVYMTATPYECFGYIKKYEDYKPGVFYHFERDYSYLDIKYFSDFEKLYEIIEASGRENWLIFIDNEKEHAKQKAKLESISSLEGKVYTVSAKSKHEKKYQVMVRDERIDTKPSKKDLDDSDDSYVTTRVLIATSVIDNGVNFRNVKNVVVSDISKTKCLQMVGRARVEEGEKVTLYIKRFTEKEVDSRIKDLQNRQLFYYDFDRSTADFGAETETWFTDKYILNNEKKSSRPEHRIGTHNERFTRFLKNDIAELLVNTLVPTYEAILAEMQNDTVSKLPGQKYLEYMLSWFGHTYRAENDISVKSMDENLKKLNDFLESYAVNETQMFKEEQAIFRSEYTRLHDETFGKWDKNKERDNYGSDVINKSLKKQGLGYEVKSVDAKPTYWQVIRCDRSADMEQ